MNQIININGTFYSENEAVFTIQNRAFKYGDAVFETIRVINGTPVNIDAHFERLKKGMQLLKLQLSKNLTFQYLLEQINLTLSKNNITQGGKIRLTVYRDNGGTYTPLTNKKSFAIEAQPLNTNLFKLNTQGLKISIFKDFKLQKTPLSNIKTANALPFVLASIYAQEQQLNDVILLNEHNRLCECTSSNIFLYKNNTLYTPSIDEGCLNGTMRNQIIAIAKQMGITVFECTLVSGNLMQVDEIWLTNAISGIQWVKQCNNIQYNNFIAQKIINKINQQYQS